MDAMSRALGYSEGGKSSGNSSVMAQHAANDGVAGKQVWRNTLAEEYGAMADQMRKSFNEKFWNPARGCLFDVLGTEGADASLRPNQIFAVSLNYTMLDKEKNLKVVDVVNRELVTPYGLRTLSENDPGSSGRCFGDSKSRDTAYHNGTIWPWLLGPYVTAQMKVSDYSANARKQAMENLLLPLFSVGIHQRGLGTISEIYDGDSPNAPRGCIAQAWSVAEPLRAYVEDVLGIKPRFSKADLKFRKYLNTAGIRNTVKHVNT